MFNLQELNSFQLLNFCVKKNHFKLNQMECILENERFITFFCTTFLQKLSRGWQLFT